ncbi:MAG: PAS domain S-box protein, partial [Candidatus Eremiobacteraeota bacterium]|nr:PAS domain S-box protein [Candidatus Eremiobacteraeota bacterium]
MRPVLLRRLKTSLAFKLALLAVLLSVPIFSVAASQYGVAADQIALVNGERRGVAFLYDGSRSLQAIAATRLTPRLFARDRAKMRAGIPAQDRRAVRDGLAAFARTGADLSDMGIGPELSALPSSAWREFEAAPNPRHLEAAGLAILKAQGLVADASRLSYEPHVIEANLGDALSTENAVILQRLSAASATAEVGASPTGVSVRDRIAIATYVGSADAAAVSLAVDRAGAVEAGGALDPPLEAAWNELERSRTALRAPLQLVVAGDRSPAVTPTELAARKRTLVSASARFVVLLERRLNVLFDARAATARRMQLLVILGSLVAALLSGGMVALIGRVVVRRDRRELLAAQQQSRTFGAELAQQRAEKALLLTQAQFTAIFERSNMGIALLDASGGTIEGNARLAELLGGAQVIPPHDAAFAELVKGTTATYHCERALERDDARRWLEMTVSLVSVPKPAPVTAIAMVRDITDRKAMDERMRYAA